MSFLGSIGKIFTRVVTGVATGGASEIVRAVAPRTARQLESVFSPSLSQALPLGVAAFTGNPAPILTTFSPGGGQPMAFNIGQFLGNVGGALSGSRNPFISGLGNVSGFAAGFVPQPTSRPVYPPPGGNVVMTGGNQVVRLGASQSLTKDVFDAGAKLLLRLGFPVPTVSSRFTAVLSRVLTALSAFARRTPTGTLFALLAGMGLTAYEVSTLIGYQATKKRRRRMNPANSKALRRAGRRIRSFHKLCKHLDVVKPHRRSAGRCGTCRKSPCSC